MAICTGGSNNHNTLQSWKIILTAVHYTVYIISECIALWDEPNELSIQHDVYIFIQYIDS